MQSSSAAKAALNVICMNQTRIARDEAKQAQQDLEKTRLDALAKALKERCFLLEQCLVQERKDSHRLRHELNLAKSKKSADAVHEQVESELVALRDLVERQANLIERMHHQK